NEGSQRAQQNLRDKTEENRQKKRPYSNCQDPAAPTTVFINFRQQTSPLKLVEFRIQNSEDF
ncbi:MAG: hypothetical protein AB1767_11285, partial [Bacillota bacterium]